MTNSSEKIQQKTSNELIEKKKMPKLWSCLFSPNDEDKKSEQINKRINAELKQDEKTYKATYRLLLLGLLTRREFDDHIRVCVCVCLGAGESGKSTVVKQMKILHNPFKTQYEMDFRLKKNMF